MEDDIPLNERARQIVVDLMAIEGLSLRELANTSGVSRSAIRDFIEGNASPSISTYERIVRGCGATLEIQAR